MTYRCRQENEGITFCDKICRREYLFAHAEDRYRKYVDPRESWECWPYTGFLNKDGYGWFSIGKKGMNAHTFAWMLVHGPIPKGMVVCHSCDVNYPAGDITYRSCQNPAHLWLGTHQDNQDDKMAKGRQARGERTNTAKLTEDQVREVRRLYANGDGQTALARRFGMTQGAMWRIVHRLSWAHVH